MTLPPDPRDWKRTHPLAARLVHWPPAWREWHAELAGRIQFDGKGCSREEADARAEEILRDRFARWGDGPVWTRAGR